MLPPVLLDVLVMVGEGLCVATKVGFGEDDELILLVACADSTGQLGETLLHCGVAAGVRSMLHDMLCRCSSYNAQLSLKDPPDLPETYSFPGNILRPHILAGKMWKIESSLPTSQLPQARRKEIVFEVTLV